MCKYFGHYVGCHCVTQLKSLLKRWSALFNPVRPLKLSTQSLLNTGYQQTLFTNQHFRALLIGHGKCVLLPHCRGNSPNMGSFPNMGSCIISYQEMLRCLLKNIKHQAHEAVRCNHSINGQLLRTSVLSGRLYFGALWNVCLSLNCDSLAVDGRLLFWISLVLSSLLSAILNPSFVS